METFIKFLKRKRKFKNSFAEATEAEMEQLTEIGKGKLPAELLEVYQTIMPNKNIEISDFVMYSVQRIKEENFDAVPGANIYPYGLFVFMSTLDGDAICIDLNDENGAIYQCSHSLLSNEERISFYKRNMVSLDFTYENIIRCSVKLADSYRDFTEKLMNKKVYAYNVVRTVIDNY